MDELKYCWQAKGNSHLAISITLLSQKEPFLRVKGNKEAAKILLMHLEDSAHSNTGHLSEANSGDAKDAGPVW